MADILTRTKAHNDDTCRFCDEPIGRLVFAWWNHETGFCHKACKGAEAHADAEADADELIEGGLLAFAT